MEMFDDWTVVKVFIVLICHSMKPFDLGQRGEDVMWSMACDDRNCEKGSEEKWGPLSEKKHCGVPYCKKKGLVSFGLCCLRSWNGLCI